MLKSTKKILDELYEIDPNFKTQAKSLKSLVVFLEHHNPQVQASKEFKNKLKNKLNTIWEFKQIQPKSKMNFMGIIRPLFLTIFWVFVLLQFHNFLSIKHAELVATRALLSEKQEESVFVWSDDVSEPSDINILWDLNEEENIEDPDTLSNTENTTEQVDDDTNEDRVDEPAVSQASQEASSVSSTTESRVTPQESSEQLQQTQTQDIESFDSQAQQSEDIPQDQSTLSDQEQSSALDNAEQSSEQNTQESQNVSTMTVEDDESAPSPEQEAPTTVSNTEEASTTSSSNKQEQAENTEDNADMQESSTTVRTVFSSERWGWDSEMTNSASTDTTKQDDQVDEDKESSPNTSWDQADDANEETNTSDSQETQAKRTDYYRCDAGKIQYIDEVDKRRIIKTYCSEKWWEYNRETYECMINVKKWVSIDYIERDLCQ